MKRRLTINATWAFAGQATVAACHWAGLIVVARLGGADELGRYALALAIVTPAMLFGGLQVRELQTADADEQYEFGDYLAVRLAGTSIAAIALLVVAWTGYAASIALPIVMVMIARAVENISEVYQGVAHRRQRMDLVAWSLTGRAVLGLVALVAVYAATADLVVALAAVAVTRPALLLIDRALVARLRPATRAPAPALARRLALGRVALPLGVASLLIGLNPNIPRYAIEADAGLAALGLFAAMAHFVVAGRMMITAASQAAFPKLADLHVAGDHDAFRALMRRLVLVSMAPAVGGMLLATLFGREILVLMYGQPFAAAAPVFPWVMLVGLCLYAQTPFGYALTATRQLTIQPLLFGVVVAINAVGCLFLVPGYGLMGATFAWLVSITAQLAMSVALHWRYLRGYRLSENAPRSI